VPRGAPRGRPGRGAPGAPGRAGPGRPGRPPRAPRAGPGRAGPGRGSREGLPGGFPGGLRSQDSLGHLITDPTGDAFRELHAMHRSCPRQQRDSREGPRAVTHLLGEHGDFTPSKCGDVAERVATCCGVVPGISRSPSLRMGTQPMLGNQRQPSRFLG